MSAASSSRRYAIFAKFLLCGLLSGVVISHAVSAEAASSRTEQRGNPYTAYIDEAAQRFGVPAHWILAIMRRESAGDARAISERGAMGLMQIMPATWAELRARYGLGSDPFEPRDNILAGTAYLRELHDRFGSPGFLAAYNAGPTRYAEHLTTGRPLPRETRDYVAALAPLVGASIATERHEQSALLTVDWRAAPLFAAHTDRHKSTDEAPQSSSADAYPPHTSGASDSLFPPHGNGDRR